MGVRIDASAVDVPRLEEFLAQPTGWVLQYVVEHGTDREVFVSWWEPDCGPVCAIPGNAVFRVRGGEKRVIPGAACSSDPFLARPAGDHLRDADSFSLKGLLRALSQCPEIAFVRVITGGHRRWWIGSLLDFAEQILAAEDYARLAILWLKVLRGYDCGKLLPHARFDLASFDFPILSAEDCDLWIGVWTEEEAYFVADCLEQILEWEPRLKSPPGTVGMGPAKVDDWNDWVHEMARHFLAIREIRDYHRLAVITFIHS